MIGGLPWTVLMQCRPDVPFLALTTLSVEERNMYFLAATVTPDCARLSVLLYLPSRLFSSSTDTWPAKIVKKINWNRFSSRLLGLLDSVGDPWYFWYGSGSSDSYLWRALWNRNYLLPVPVPTFEKLWLRFRLLKSFGSGSGYYFWKVTVPVPIQAPYLDHKKKFAKKFLDFFFAFLHSQLPIWQGKGL